MDSKWIKLIVLLGIADVVLCGTCPTWTSGRCLSDTSTLVTYDAAVAACEELCAHLVVINDTDTYNAATLLISGEAADKKAWIGLKHDAGQNAYLWLDDSALYSAAHWQAGSPSSNSGCRAAYHEFSNFLTHGFKDDACSATHRYFCERNTGTDCSYVKIPGASFTVTNSGLHSCNEGNNCCSVDARLSYSCDGAGFSLSGFGGDAVCQSSGSYDVDASAGSCVGPPCSNLTIQAANHVSVDSVSGDIGDTSNFTCEANYHISAGVTQANTTCEWNGTASVWTNSVPTCSAIPCSTPTSVDYATPDQTSNTQVGDVVVYTCDGGYEQPDGSLSASSTCVAGGTWNPNVDSCQGRPCANLTLTADNNVQANATNGTLGDVVEFTCDTHYQLPNATNRTPNATNSTTAQCTWNGTAMTWTEDVPTCIAIPCGPLPNMSNTQTMNETSNTSVGALVTFKCNSGWQTSDGNQSFSIECQLGGTWSAGKDCNTVVTCPPAPNVTFASDPSTNETTYNTTVTYTCDPNYMFTGGGFHRSIYCQENGTWDIELTTCIEPIHCTLPTVNNADPSTNNNTVFPPTKVDYVCNQEHIFHHLGTQFQTITCEHNGFLSANPGHCTFEGCSPVPSINNGAADSANKLNGATITYTCDVKHAFPDGLATRTIHCSSRTWSEPTPPDCQFVQCSALPSNLPRVTANIQPPNSREFGTHANFTCDINYLFPSKTNVIHTECLGNGTWSVNITDGCTDTIQCAAVNPISNGTYDNNGTSFNTSVTYTCDTGYMFPDRDTSKTVRCTEAGVWSALVPSACTEIFCPSLPDLTNGTVSTNDTKYGTEVKYSCQQGFIFPDGSTEQNLKCVATGNWNDTVKATTCSVINCTSPPTAVMAEPFDVGTYNASLGSMFGTVLTYNCTNNTVFSEGSTQRTTRCSSSGKWVPPHLQCDDNPVVLKKQVGRYPPKEAPLLVVVATGSFGLILVASLVGFIFFLDLITIKKHLQLMQRNLSNVFECLRKEKDEELEEEEEEELVEEDVSNRSGSKLRHKFRRTSQVSPMPYV